MLPRSETRGHETFSSPNVFTTSVGTQPGRKEAGVPKTVSEQTERLKRHWEKEAPTYDRRMSFFESREGALRRRSGVGVLTSLRRGAGGGRGNGTQLPLLPARCAANRHRSEPTHARDRLGEG